MKQRRARHGAQYGWHGRPCQGRPFWGGLRWRRKGACLAAFEPRTGSSFKSVSVCARVNAAAAAASLTAHLPDGADERRLQWLYFVCHPHIRVRRFLTHRHAVGRAAFAEVVMLWSYHFGCSRRLTEPEPTAAPEAKARHSPTAGLPR